MDARPQSQSCFCVCQIVLFLYFSLFIMFKLIPISTSSSPFQKVKYFFNDVRAPGYLWSFFIEDPLTHTITLVMCHFDNSETCLNTTVCAPFPNTKLYSKEEIVLIL